MLIKRLFYFNSGISEEWTESSSISLEHLGRIVCYKGLPFQFVAHDRTAIPPQATYGEMSSQKFMLHFGGTYDEVLSLSHPFEEELCCCGATAVGSSNHSTWCDVEDSICD